MFLEWSGELRAEEVVTAPLLGVLLTKLEPTTRISREIRDELMSSDLPMFETMIPKRTAAERMVGDASVLGDEQADLDLSEAYGHFTLEVIRRVREQREEKGSSDRG